MEIQGTGVSSLYRQNLEIREKSKDSEESTAEAEETAVTTSAPKGVIRNILDGHFKGVADIRLRINFYDELTAIQNEAVKTQTKEGSASLLGVVKNLSEELQTAEYLSDEKKELAAKFFIDFVNDVEENVLEKSFDINASFLTLTSAPKTLEEDESEESPLGGFISKLEESFKSALDEFNEKVENTNVLPPLSEPSGKGKAYDKFLAIYQALDDTASSTEDKLNLSV